MGWKIAFALDGPRGPRYQPKPGALILAEKTGKPILLLVSQVSHAYRFRSWDGFCLPLPFARVALRSLLWRPNTGASLEEAIVALQQTMTDLRNPTHPLDD